MQDTKDLEKSTSSRGAGVERCVGSLREGGKSKDPTTRWIQVFSAGETGGETGVEGEGVSVWEAGEV